MTTYVSVAAERDVRPGRARSVEVGAVSLLLCNVDGDIYAVADVCTHDRGPLGEGRLRGAAIECPRHGARFDVRDGSVLTPPAIRPLPTYATRVVDGQVEVLVPEEASP
ncbi:MAG TPA: non-heme iron oxygenase ferredoxin subunit [Acidimicrobiia bacterium]|nr:non-heme iron oxygenase ferredoxin subunit [Acidimicrobiia bacterium]